MGDYVHIQIRRDTSTNWSRANPVLKLGEIGFDMTLRRLKVGDGVRSWNDLSWLGPEVVNDLLSGGPDKALSAEQGKELKRQLGEVETSVQNIISSGGVPVIDNLSSTSRTSALSANMGRELDSKKADASTVNNLTQTVNNITQKVDGLGIFGMGYTVDSFNGYGKPTRITFSDGVSATLTWAGTRLEEIRASTGERITMNYNGDGLITGRTVTQS